MRNPWLSLMGFIIFAYGIVMISGTIHAVVQEEDWQGEQRRVEQDVTLPEYIVIFDYPVERATLNLRMIVRAKSEGEAVMRATLNLVDNFRNQIDSGKLSFIEVALRPDPNKKK